MAMHDPFHTVEICLVRDVFNNTDDPGNLEDRQHAYIYENDEWKTPTEFDGGATIPARYAITIDMTVQEMKS